MTLFYEQFAENCREIACFAFLLSFTGFYLNITSDLKCYKRALKLVKARWFSHMASG